VLEVVMSAVPDPGTEVSPERFGQEWADDYDELEVTSPAETALMVDVVAGLAGPGPVLDAAAATGRLAVPLARRGLRVVATDASPAMLARLRAKDPDGLVETRVEVLPHIGGDETFSLIAVLANSLWVLPDVERQEAFLRTAAGRLVPGGRLVVDQHELNPAGYAAGREWDQHGIRFSRRSRFDPATQRLVHRFTAVRPDGSARVRDVHLRPMAVAELTAGAGRAGLHLEHAWRDWSRVPYAPGDPTVVAVFQVP
jgi:SAM-dependent methyltransferase